MKRLLFITIFSTLLAGCAARQPMQPYPSDTQAGNAAPVNQTYPDQPYYGPRTSIGIGLGNWGGRGVGGVGIGMGW